MKPTLLVLAAGLGSRYGGLKQLDGIGPNQEIIMDYSIFDSLNAGFGKVVLIVQEHMVEILTERYITKLNLPIEFAIQTKELVLNDISYVNQRPWGTAHALWCAKEHIKGSFLMINADDFYGQDSFVLAYNHLAAENTPCAIAFPILKTLSENGSVNRAEIQIENGFLSDSIEREKIIVNEDAISYTDANNVSHNLDKDCFVSMNMFGFTTQIFDYIDTDVYNFIAKWKENNALEYQLPTVVSTMIKEGIFKVKVLITNEEWIGITYQSDKELAKNRIQKLHDIGVYKEKLWDFLKM
jgi:dTDP-glucose pyrophosphorylase